MGGGGSASGFRGLASRLKGSRACRSLGVKAVFGFRGEGFRGLEGPRGFRF